jgi:hypothetical protein
MKRLHFTAMIRIHQANPYILVSRTRATALKAGWRKPLPVRVRINGKPVTAWRINMMPVGNGSFYLYLHGDVRRASRTKVGDRVDTEVAFDAAYRAGPTHPLPTRFRTALNKTPQALVAWRALIPSRQKEILRYLSGLKSPETLARNVRKALRVLSGKKERFMARAWRDGS